MRMTNLLRAIAVIGGLMLGMAMPATASADYAVVTNAVHLRVGPGVGFARLATIPGGASLWVEFCRPKWCNVIWRNLRGWVARSYLGIGYGPPAPRYDQYYYYDYDFGYPFPYPWPHPPHKPPHKPPHCKPGDDCHKPPHCKPGDDCKPWQKPDDREKKKWRDRSDRIGLPQAPMNDGPKTWKKLDRDEQTFSGEALRKSYDARSAGDDADEDRGRRDWRKWDD
jgi:uncharacterized protein YraI